MNKESHDYLLTPEQAAKNPHFSYLLNDLKQRFLGRNNASRVKEEMLQTALKKYAKAKSEYETIEFLYNSLWEIIINPTMESEEKKELEDVLISSELCESAVIPLEGTIVYPFGLQLNKPELSKDTQLWAFEQIRQLLIQKGSDILQQIGTAIPENNHELLMAKLTQLPHTIDGILDEQNREKEELLEKRQKSEEQHSKYMTTLLESLQLLQELLVKQLIEGQSEHYVITTQSLKAQCDALYFKIKSLHLEILCETYNKETVMALNTISKLLDKNIEQTEGEIESCKTRLRRYESVGSEFQALVDEYSQLKEAIKNKKWTLEKLQSYRK